MKQPWVYTTIKKKKKKTKAFFADFIVSTFALRV